MKKAFALCEALGLTPSPGLTPSRGGSHSPRRRPPAGGGAPPLRYSLLREGKGRGTTATAPFGGFRCHCREAASRDLGGRGSSTTLLSATLAVVAGVRRCRRPRPWGAA